MLVLAQILTLVEPNIAMTANKGLVVFLMGKKHIGQKTVFYCHADLSSNTSIATN